MNKPGLADVVIAPLIILERSRGWMRRGLDLFYLVIGLAIGVLGWREMSLWRLPKSPEPFDLAKHGRVEVADADNAMVAYRVVFASTSNIAIDTLSASSTSSATSGAVRIGSGNHGPTYCSRFLCAKSS